MEAYALVDLELVKVSLDELEKLLSTLKYRVMDLYEEKASRTWTEECSRSDLMAIAKLLPPRSEWRSEAFTIAKKIIMDQFGLGSRKFSAAVEKIEAGRAGRHLLGLETPLAHLTDEHALLVVELWGKRHPPRHHEEGHGFIVYPRDIDWEEARERRKIAGDINTRLMTELRPEEVADLETIFYIGRERWLPEFYEKTLDRTKKEHALEGDLAMKLNHLMEKLNLADELQRGVSRLGRPSLGDKIGALIEARSASDKAVP